MTNQTIDGVPRLRELLERVATEANHMLGFTYAANYDECRAAVDELRALLDAELTPCAKSQVEPAAQPQDKASLLDPYDVGTFVERSPNGCENCAMDLSTCDCVEPKPVRWTYSPSRGSTDQPQAQKYDDTLLPFVALMRKELHANAGKGDRPGWLAMSSDTCLLEIIYHFGKLQASVKRGDGDGMAEYAADVANLCMMLMDICGVINLVRHAEHPAPVARCSFCDATAQDGNPWSGHHKSVDGKLIYRVMGCKDHAHLVDSLRGAEPFPVALVLPERRVQPNGFTGKGWAELRGWNACLDELKRLNAKPK